MVFRVVDESNFYYFMIDYLQQVLMFKMENGEWVELVPAYQDTSLRVEPGAENTFGVLVLGDYIEFYLNGTLVGTAVDRVQKIGGPRPAHYTYSDSDSLVSAVFDDFAYLPLTIDGHPSLDEDAVLPLGTVRVGGTIIRDGIGGNAAQLGALDAGQIVVALARAADNSQVFGYARGAAGWIAADTIDLTLDAEPYSIQALPVLSQEATGTTVEVWPVVWPDDEALTDVIGTESDATSVPAVLMIAYGQTVQDTIADDGTQTWLFSGVAGDVITLGTAADDSALDLYIRLLGPDGTPAIEDDDSGLGLNPLIENFTLPQSGLYTIEIESLGPGGPFQLALAKN
jgi:hypothetical protein